MVTLEANLRIGSRDRLILWHVYRYGLTHKEVVYRLFFDPAKHQLEAARKTLRRLREGGYLDYFSQPWPYYRLAPAGARLLEALLGLAPDSLRPATRRFKVPDALFERCALLAFCCLREPRRELLLTLEFDRWLTAWACQGLRSWPYYIERDDAGSVLCLAIVDSGSSADSQVKRAGHQLHRRLRVPAICELERLGRFRITLLTPAPQRASELQRAFYDAQVSLVRVVVVSEVSRIAPTVLSVT